MIEKKGVKGDMNYYFAPMEGITGYIYRNAHSRYFEKADKYYTPFLTPDKNRTFKTRELEDISPEHNKGLCAVPQILTNRAEDFVRASLELGRLGYGEVNLNLGCPSGTVVSKGRGAGFLAKPEELERFFEQVFSALSKQAPKLRISVKTRIGKDSADEFSDLLAVFNQYPIFELTVHPRTQKDFYKGEPDLNCFSQAVKESRNPLCYNGNLYTPADYEKFINRFPAVDSVMLGRGLVSNPALPGILKGKPMPERAVFREFHEKLYQDYRQALPGDMPVLFKMKELWLYMAASFADSGKYEKKIKKAKNLKDYETIVNALFSEAELKTDTGTRGTAIP